jgi:DNA-binding MarR family transcriptional regulator
MPNPTSPTRARPNSAPLKAEELAAWRGMLRAHSQLTRQLDSELKDGHGLPLSAYEVLLFLEGSEGGAMRMSELADSVLLSHSGVTRRVDVLERDGLVERRRCPSDARGLLAVLTDSGRAALAEARTTHLAGVRRHFLARFSEEELGTFGGFWDRLLVDDAPDGPSC